MRRPVPILMIFIVLLASTMVLSNERIEHLDSVPSTGVFGMTRAGEITFLNVSEEVGLGYVNGNFFSWGDYDNDGFQDLLVDGKMLFRNSGPPSFTFSDQTSQSGISAPVNSGVFGDFDNDGWLDLFCGGGRGSSDHPEFPDILWHNERDGTFRKVPLSDEVPNDTYPTAGAGWGDMDRDGYLDIYMVNYEDASYQGYSDHFWLNNGDGSFTNATASSGMSEGDHPYQGRGVSWCDFNNDGFQDVYISNYRIMRNYLYMNLGNGTMKEVGQELGAEGHGNLHPITREGPYYGHSLGSSWGDLDNDGDMDIWVTNLAHKDVYRGPICDDSYLFENMGEEGGYRFEDAREGSGIDIKPLGGAVSGGDELMVSSGLADYDNDGFLDLFIPQIYGDVPYAYSYLYRNQGDLTFTEVGSEAGLRVWNTYGSAWCDYDNDGWIDLVTGGGVWDQNQSATDGYMVHLFRNQGGTGAPERDWIEMRLHGRESNTAAIGARVSVKADTDGNGSPDLTVFREVQGGTAAHGQQDSMVLHFGLGEVKGQVDISVNWPMGRVTDLKDTGTRTLLELFEPTDPIEMTVKIADVHDTDGDAEVDVMIDNPSDHKISLSVLNVTFSYADGEMTDLWQVSEIAPRGQKEISGPSDPFPYDGLVSVEVTLERSYPPVVGSTTDIFSIPFISNEPPVAVLKVSMDAFAGEELTFDGSSSFDPDGTLDSYEFHFGDGTGTGWTRSGSVTHSYSRPGNYTAILSVMDDEGLVSLDPAVSVVRISENADQRPTARIISIDPEEALEGSIILFEGEGIPPEGRRITEYEWSSSIDDILSRRAFFDDDGLSVGDHVISFRVRDSSGLWSIPAEGSAEIIGDRSETPWVTIYTLAVEGPLTGNVLITGSCGPSYSVEYVEVKVDSDPWKRARGAPDWEFLLDTTELDPGRQHSIQARSFADRYHSDIVEMTFLVGVSNGSEPGSGASAPGDSAIEVPVVVGSGLALFMVVVLIGTYFFIRRSGKREIRRYIDDLRTTDDPDIQGP